MLYQRILDMHPNSIETAQARVKIEQLKTEYPVLYKSFKSNASVPNQHKYDSSEGFSGYTIFFIAISLVLNLGIGAFTYSFSSNNPNAVAMILMFLNCILYILYNVFKFLFGAANFVADTAGVVASVAIDEIRSNVNSGSDDLSVLKYEFQKDNTNVKAAFNLSRKLLSDDRIVEAKSVIVKLIDAAPTGTSFEYGAMALDLAYIYQHSYEYEKSLSLCDDVVSKCIAKCKDRALEIAADTCIAEGIFDMAFSYLNKLGNKGKFKIAVLLVDNYYDYNAAIDILEDLSRNMEANADVELLLGRCYHSIGNSVLLEDRYKRLYELDKKLASELYDLMNRTKAGDDHYGSAKSNTSERDGDSSKNNEHYAVLEIPTGSDSDTVKRAYRELVKVWHPDRFQNDVKLQQKAIEKMKLINEAFRVLYAIG